MLEFNNLESIKEALAGGFLGGIFATFILLGILIVAGFYIYHALAWQTIAKKLKHKKSWLAWIPFANISLILQLGRFHWAWVFLFLIPLIGWIALYILMIVSYWRVFEKRKYPGWLGLAPLLPKVGSLIYMVVIGFVAWKDKPKKKK